MFNGNWMRWNVVLKWAVKLRLRPDAAAELMNVRRRCCNTEVSLNPLVPGFAWWLLSTYVLSDWALHRSDIGLPGQYYSRGGADVVRLYCVSLWLLVNIAIASITRRRFSTARSSPIVVFKVWLHDILLNNVTVLYLSLMLTSSS